MQMWIAWPFLLYLGERLYGLFRAETWDTQVVGASILDPGVLTLELTKPPGFTYKCACCPTAPVHCTCTSLLALSMCCAALWQAAIGCVSPLKKSLPMSSQSAQIMMAAAPFHSYVMLLGLPGLLGCSTRCT